MAKKHLVTTSLIGAVEWAKGAPHSIIKPDKGGDGQMTWAQKAVKDLRDTVNRAPYKANVAAERGIAFESKVYVAARTGQIPVGASEHFKKVVDLVIGGEFQRKGKMDYTVENYDCFLYGKEDAYFPTVIRDIKTTQTFKAEKYMMSIQHIMYCFMEDLWNFEYVIAEWETYPKIKGVHIIPIQPDPDMAKNILDRKIISTFNFLKEHGLWEVYREKYCLY